ncbi:MAG: methyltransferase domain-containing protein [Alphaproteobacteria bacterium]|nr:methyltransferase domain-containing protein [Alphaproteobacteria bacterium]
MSVNVRFLASNQEVAFTGPLRPASEAELDEAERCLREAAASVTGRLYVNLRRVPLMNHRAFRRLGRVLLEILDARPDLTAQLVISSAVPWAARRGAALAARSPRLTVEPYDRDFYPGQGVIENDHLLPVLRAQTRVIWSHEQKMLALHGLEEGMAVADICCGIGDFALLLRGAFHPGRLVAVDHARPFLEYARAVAREFGIADIEYVYGDATSLYLEDAQFDFVISRLALQIFDRPQQILGELYRICKPGGRVYITNELMRHIYAWPRSERVAWAYTLIPEMAAKLGMDVNFGPKAHAALKDFGFQDVRMDRIEVTNLNTDIEDFAAVAAGWRDYVTQDVASATAQPPETVAALQDALDSFLRAVESPKGFASWPIYVASGTRPLDPVTP